MFYVSLYTLNEVEEGGRERRDVEKGGRERREVEEGGRERRERKQKDDKTNIESRAEEY